MSKRIYFFAIIFLALSATAALAEVAIEAKVDKSSLAAGELLSYSIKVTGSEEELPYPAIPDFKGFKVVSQAQSSSMVFSPGQGRSVMEFAFVLAPAAAGKIKIGPASVKVNDKTISSASFEIEVKGGGNMQAQPPEKGAAPENNRKAQPQIKEPQITL